MSMRDPYTVLGVDKKADATAVKSAYRKLAKKLHPDVNQGDKDVERRFKEVTAAYDLLSDPAKRARFDRGEIDADGNERGFHGDPFAGARQRGRGQGRAGPDPFGGLNPDDFFAEFFGGAGTTGGQDALFDLHIPFTEACLGGKRRITLAGHKTVDVNIPPGTVDGHKLRLRGLGQAGRAGKPGDALITIHVDPHPHFTRKGQDIHLDTPISLVEAASGASIRVPTLDGFVAIKVPAGANSDAVLRLKGKGIPKTNGAGGDMFVRLKIMLPTPLPSDLTELIEKWSKKHNYDPRKKLGWS